MNFSIFLCIVCLCLALSLSEGRRHRREASLNFKSTPKLVVEGVTQELKLECNTPSSLTDVFIPIVIRIEKTDVNASSTDSIATQILSRDLVAVEDSRIRAEGKLQSKSEEVSSLVIQIEKPQVNDSGKYTCTFDYLDFKFQTRTLTKSANVTVVEIAPVSLLPVPDEQCDCKDIWVEINKIKESNSKDIELLKLNIQALEKSSQVGGAVIASPQEVSDDSCKAAFSARFARRDGNPIVSESVIVFDAVTTNKGEAYDVKSGEFTAPCSGQYFFTVTLRTHQDLDSGYVDGVLQVDGQELARTSVHLDAPIENMETSTNGLVVKLEKGQKISVVTKTTSSGSFIGESYSIFSGFFLFP
ncbi:uncharacterized protein LOC106069827 [Biomphalaria glabrata]|uniref:Uncharacterized protein LOC106069827 n=1 Tax=Biomphalaria glabrata TaxID=6526 RepID=A0A9U8EF13_BIOGL|nr:uncharacterized protein LOC106069827 [Biomphalaria glabrata]